MTQLSTTNISLSLHNLKNPQLILSTDIDKLLFFSKNNWYPDELETLPFNPEKTVFVL